MYYRSAWVDGQNVAKADIRNGFRDFSVWIGTITQIRAAAMAGHKNVVISDGAGVAQPYYLDAGDGATADNGTTVLVSSDGGRYKRAGAVIPGHDHVAAEVTDFAEAVQDVVAAMIVAGTNMTITYDDGAGTLTFVAAGGGGGGTNATNLAFSRSATTVTIASDTGDNAVILFASETEAGVTRKATTAEVRSGASDAYVAGTHLVDALAPVTLTFATSQPIDFKGGFNQRIVLTDDCTLQLPTNPVPGRWVHVDLIQDGTGTHIVGFATGYQFPGKTAPTVTTAANAKTKLSIYCDDASTFVVIASLDIGAPA